MSDTNYLLGRGPIYIANRAADGTPGALTDIGECLIFSLEITKEYKENKSTRYPIAEKDVCVPVSQELKLMLTLKENTAANLELILHGKKTANAGGSVSAQAFPAGIVAGEEYVLPGFKGIASSLVVTDSAGTPATLVLGTHYTVDLTNGRVKFVSVGSYTQPFKAAYTQAASTRNSILAQDVANKYLRFEGINIGNNGGNKNFIVEIYNGKLKPVKKVDFKGEDHAMFEIEVECLIDVNKAEDPELGRYGNYIGLN